MTTGSTETETTVFYVDKNKINELKDIINENENKVKYEETSRFDCGTTITLYKYGIPKNTFTDSSNKAANENFANICKNRKIQIKFVLF